MAKAVSPGDKSNPFRKVPVRPVQVVPDPVGPMEQYSHQQLDSIGLNHDWSDLLRRDDALRVLFDYDAVYGTLGSTTESMEAAVYELFSMMFQNWGRERRFTYQDAYRCYKFFPVEACTTTLSSCRHTHLARVLRVDPHFIRFPKVAMQKSWMPRSWLMEVGTFEVSSKENVLMVGGSALRKSTILKMLRAIVRNKSTNEDQPGIDEVLTQLGFKERGQKDCDDDSEIVSSEELFWHLFNPRIPTQW